VYRWIIFEESMQSDTELALTEDYVPQAYW